MDFKVHKLTSNSVFRWSVIVELCRLPLSCLTIGSYQSHSSRIVLCKCVELEGCTLVCHFSFGEVFISRKTNAKFIIHGNHVEINWGLFPSSLAKVWPVGSVLSVIGTSSHGNSAECSKEVASHLYFKIILSIIIPDRFNLTYKWGC